MNRKHKLVIELPFFDIHHPDWDHRTYKVGDVKFVTEVLKQFGLEQYIINVQTKRINWAYFHDVQDYQVIVTLKYPYKIRKIIEQALNNITIRYVRSIRFIKK